MGIMDGIVDWQVMVLYGIEYQAFSCDIRSY